MNTTYLVGSNVPGYSPDSEPDTFPTLLEAREALLTELEAHVDWLADALGSDALAVREATEAVQDVDNDRDWLVPFTGKNVWMPALDSRHDLGRVFWIDLQIGDSNDFASQQNAEMLAENAAADALYGFTA